MMTMSIMYDKGRKIKMKDKSLEERQRLKTKLWLKNGKNIDKRVVMV